MIDSLVPQSSQHLVSGLFLFVRLAFVLFVCGFLVVVFIIALQIFVRWNLKMVLACLSLIAKDGEHFLRYFCAIFCLLRTILFRILPSCHWDICFFDSFGSSMPIMSIDPLSYTELARVPFYSIESFFNPLIVSVAGQKLFISMRYYLSIFSHNSLKNTVLFRMFFPILVFLMVLHLFF